jgi:hypothetical protein
MNTLAFNEQNQIVLYQPDNAVSVEVRVDGDTVWLTQAQMTLLFNKDKRTISEHISNIFKEKELKADSVIRNFRTTAADGKNYVVNHYNLDVIISVGYRVKSKQGTLFRQWATQTLKSYMLYGYAVNSAYAANSINAVNNANAANNAYAINSLNVVNQRFERFEYRLSETERKIDFFVQTALPPMQGIFYDGQIFEAYAFVARVVKDAKKSIVLIDNYIDEQVLLLLSKRAQGVTAEIFTASVSAQLQLDIDKHNAQFSPVIITINKRFHDRFLLIDDVVYHIGASLKDLGKKLFAFSKLACPKEQLFPKPINQ